MIDLAIIGGGPAGYVAAERAGAKGLSVTLFEKRELGGVCLNEGCIPTKTLLYSAKVYNYALHGDKYGISAGSVECDYSKVVSRKDKVVRKLVGGVSAAMKANKVSVVKGEAVIEGRGAEGITISCGGEKYVAANLLICSGSEAAVPPIPGLKEAGDIVVTNREILSLKEQPKELVVIGGGVIGMEFAAFFNTLGTKVTVVEMLPKILGPLDDEISAALQKIYAKRGIEFCLGCKVTGIEKNTVVYQSPDGKECRVSGDRILLSVGRRSNVKGIGLENIGVEVERGIKVDNRMRTNIPNVFAAGDCVSGYPMLAHVASRQGEIVVANLAGGNEIMRTEAVPSVVYTNPEVACVGLTEAGARAVGKEYKVVNLPMAYAGRFVAENEGGEGFCKVIVGARHGEILGVHMMGNTSSEIIYGCCIAIEMEMTVEELKQIIYPHPTVSEIIKESVFSLK